jgi:hypothetical protein
MVYSWRRIRNLEYFVGSYKYYYDLDSFFQNCDLFPFSVQQSGQSHPFTPPGGLLWEVLEMHQTTD